MKAWCGERLTSYKDLIGGVEFVDVIPRNPSEKILKRMLKEMAKKESEQENARL